MIALYRWILGLMKKEHILRTNYHRSHPHFIIYMGLDALLSFGLVFGGFQIFRPHSSVAQELVQVGAATVSADDLIKQVKKEKVVAYWLGPISGYQYTINHQELGIADIFYMPTGSDPSDMSVFRYEVKTYRNEAVWDSHTQNLLTTANTRTITINKGLSIKINHASMKDAITTFAGHAEIVAMAYPVAQSFKTMERDAESLKPVQ
jgi:hypothetical protein